jgi:hypothetical protein
MLSGWDDCVYALPAHLIRSMESRGLLTSRALDASQVTHVFDLFRCASMCRRQARWPRDRRDPDQVPTTRLALVLQEAVLKGQAGGEIAPHRSADRLADDLLREIARHLGAAHDDPDHCFATLLSRVERSLG